MSEAKFTDAPWTADITAASFYVYNQGEYIESGGGFDIRGLNNRPIATGTWRESNKTSVAANAKLIAAAPDMYAKLDKIATWLEGNAKLRRIHAKTAGQFKSLADGYLREAKNYEATAKDVRELLAKATH